MSKSLKGQFYTTNCDYILDGFDIPNDIKIVEPSDGRQRQKPLVIVEPFAGKGDLIKWINRKDIKAYDIEPKYKNVIKRDTLLNPPNYKDKFVITNPPYLARNKCKDKTIFDIYKTNDLYKCFILSICENVCLGGIIIIPVGFFLSPRNLDVECRNKFLQQYKILKIKYFEEQVFNDTSTTIVVVSFELSDVKLKKQTIEWIKMPQNKSKTFTIYKKYDWIIGGEIYNLNGNIKISRYIHEKEYNGYLTHITLTALDSGTQNGRIKLVFDKNNIYEGKESSRSYATLITSVKLSNKQQIKLVEKFNDYIEEKRKETWSLFLPQYRESKEYARKRIPFELAYNIVSYLLEQII